MAQHNLDDYLDTSFEDTAASTPDTPTEDSAKNSSDSQQTTDDDSVSKDLDWIDQPGNGPDSNINNWQDILERYVPSEDHHPLTAFAVSEYSDPVALWIPDWFNQKEQIDVTGGWYLGDRKRDTQKAIRVAGLGRIVSTDGAGLFSGRTSRSAWIPTSVCRIVEVDGPDHVIKSVEALGRGPVEDTYTPSIDHPLLSALESDGVPAAYRIAGHLITPEDVLAVIADKYDDPVILRMPELESKQWVVVDRGDVDKWTEGDRPDSFKYHQCPPYIAWEEMKLDGFGNSPFTEWDHKYTIGMDRVAGVYDVDSIVSAVDASAPSEGHSLIWDRNKSRQLLSATFEMYRRLFAE